MSRIIALGWVLVFASHCYGRSLDQCRQFPKNHMAERAATSPSKTSEPLSVVASSSNAD